MISRVSRILLVSFLAVFLLSGCAPFVQWLTEREPTTPQASTPEKPGLAESFFSRKGKTDDLLIYFQLVQGVTAAQQEKEFDQAKTDFSRSARPEDRLRLVLLSLLPGRSAAEKGQALKLVEDYLADNGREKTGLDGLAALLKQLLAEQRTLQRQLGSEKERADGLARQLNEQKSQVDELKKQLEESKKQLDELKKIEKIISDRERKGLPEKR